MATVMAHATVMGVGSGWQGGVWSHWIFIHDTDKAEGGLIVLFFDLVFSVALLLKIFLPTPLVTVFKQQQKSVNGRGEAYIFDYICD